MDFLDSGSTSLDDGLMITSLVFYPAIYVFACEILDTLGDLVWERILRKCQYEDNGAFVRALPRVFTAEDVREEAKYTCRNWFLKIAGNRSLVGRIYLEASISRCHHFLIGSTHQEELHDRVFARLARMCRGIAHPITSTFARAYVARRGSSLLPDSSPRQFLDDLLADAVRTFHSCAADEKNQNARGLHLLRILEPCIGMVVEEHGKGLLTWRCPRGARNDRLKRALRVAAGSGAPSGLCVLRHFLKNLPRDFAVEFAPQLTQLICAAPQEDGEGGPLVKLYVEAQADCFAQMGSFLSAGGDEVRSLSGEQRRQVLNATWRVALKYSSLDHFLRVASSFAGFVTSNFGDREVSVFLQSVLRHLRDHRDSSGSPCSDHHASLVRGIVLGLFAHYSQEHGDLGPLFAQGALVPISDLAFETPERRLDFAEALLALLFKPNGRGAGSAPQLAVSDPLAQQFLLDHCQVVSDATSGDINASHTRLRRVGALVSALILRCDFGGSHEQLLGFLSTCRRSFHKLAQVQELCVHLACQAAAKILARSCGGDPRRHTAATLDAARACVAFCHVTLPSLQQAQPKLNLMLQAASVALMNGLVSQSESLVRGAVALAREEAEGAERDGFLRQCASLCLLLPGHPQLGPLYVAKDLEEACAQESDKISLLPMVCAFAQESLPYHCRGLDSSDVLYAGDEDYHRELQETGGRVIAGAVQVRSLPPLPLRRRKQKNTNSRVAHIFFCRADLSLRGLPGLARRRRCGRGGDPARNRHGVVDLLVLTGAAEQAEEPAGPRDRRQEVAAGGEAGGEAGGGSGVTGRAHLCLGRNTTANRLQLTIIMYSVPHGPSRREPPLRRRRLRGSESPRHPTAPKKDLLVPLPDLGPGLTPELVPAYSVSPHLPAAAVHVSQPGGPSSANQSDVGDFLGIPAAEEDEVAGLSLADRDVLRVPPLLVRLLRPKTRT